MRNNYPREKRGIVLMTYGSATTAEGVAAYMEHIYKGKASKELVEDFEHRYRIVGGSPLIAITKEQARLVEHFLNRDGGRREQYIVRAGMLHSAPFINEAVVALKDAGAERLKGIILSPQFSSFIMDGYSAALFAAGEENGFAKDDIDVAPAWPVEPHFIQLLAARIRESLPSLEKKYKTKIPVLFTTHSLPQRVVEKDPHYLEELQATINAVLAQTKDAEFPWYACYQSAGHTPEEWLKPDLVDILSLLEKENVPAVLIVPIQFLADHLEILYDLDIAARGQCDAHGIAYHRIELPNRHPLLIEALAALGRFY
jgi:ferrochelatase